jgi:hypothetical protein
LLLALEKAACATGHAGGNKKPFWRHSGGGRVEGAQNEILLVIFLNEYTRRKNIIN